ncbi:hypothetical protein JYU34_018203 [Plutella xylostella]|uniref:Transferrin-like domain-containing protein n=1 Tax=Plutella xylostella TaxID=51655 RepID=A0ABQ7Q1G1_PLUXY|nr:hypothetical protein JYU34_018203 [Plutella xylostella]
MGLGFALTFMFVCSLVAGQDLYKVCIPDTKPTVCRSVDKDGKVLCTSVASRVDCALKLARGEADIGVFSEEELLLLGQQQPNDHRIVATIKDLNRQDPYAFEGVAVVPSVFTGGLEGLRNGNYCHPGLDETELRWSPRVLRTLEQKVVRTDRCPDVDTNGKTAAEIEIAQLSQFFSAACRPGPWSPSSTIDANLKRDNAKLCSLCGSDPASSTCAGYTYDMGVQLSGVNNNNRHIQSLECLTRNAGTATVAFVAWQHVREYFTTRRPELMTSYSVLCEDGTTKTLTNEALLAPASPCSMVKQPYGAIVANSARAAAVSKELQAWWPNGASPGGNTWQAILFDELVGGPAARAVFDADMPTPANYTSVRGVGDYDATTSCMPARRWCSTSDHEYTKCLWTRRAAYTLGLEPVITCQQRHNVFQCLEDIRDSKADFISVDSNYGYIARQHYSLSPVKLLQNSRNMPNSMTRITALVKETSAQSDVTRFENLRGKKACFPEFGGIAYVTFVRTAHERGIISASECDYAKSVGEFFEGACAPGAIDAAHAINKDSGFDATTLCSVCKPQPSSVMVVNQTTCAWDYTNQYFGTNGTLACLADPATHVAFLETQNISADLRALNLQESQFRVLCRNNTLAAYTGINVDDNCLLALLVDEEVLARRNDPQFNSLTTLLELLDKFFGYNAAVSNQLINLEIFSPFDGVNDLLFKDSAIGLTEPSATTTHEPAKNYFELFQHLESCTGGAPGLATKKGVWSILTLFMATFVAGIMM